MTYNDEIQNKNIIKLREMCKALPDFCNEFFIGIENTTSHRTRLAYAYDLSLFFNYLKENHYNCNSVKILEKLTLTNLERYVTYLNYFEVEKDGKKIIHKNNEKGKCRKIASLRTFYKYFYKKQRISTNPASLLDVPKNHQKEIVRLEPDEVVKLLDIVETGANLTKSEMKYFEKNKKRDVALLYLLLGTGIRVSECVGIDINDIDLNVNGIKILRKGGNETIIYFGQEVKKALLDYLEERKKNVTTTNALFISLQNTRITTRAVQNLVKKYSMRLSTIKKNLSAQIKEYIWNKPI